MGQAAHDRGIGARCGGSRFRSRADAMQIWKPWKNFSGCLLWVTLRKAHDVRMLSVVSPMTDRSSHDHGTRGKPGPAARPTSPDGGWPPGTLGNGHATRMSPDRGNCLGSGLNDVHRGVGGRL